jgi:hypothetical protein
MSALFYRLLGRAVWTLALWYLRRRNGRLLLPRKLLLGGAGALVLAVAVALARRAGGPQGQLRA